jgi:hypothetical protein
LLPSEVEPVRSLNISEQPVEPITSRLTAIAYEPNNPTAHQPLRRTLRVLAETGSNLRSVDPNEAYALVATAYARN